MKKVISKAIISIMLINMLPQLASADEILEAHSCLVKIKKTGQEVDAICGKKIDPKYGGMRSYRTFQDPTDGLTVEQYQLNKNEVHTVKERIRTATASQNIRTRENENQQPEVNAYVRPADATKSEEEMESDDLTTKWFIVGAALVTAVIGVVGTSHYMSSKGSLKERTSNGKEEKILGNVSSKTKKPAILKDLPKNIKLGNDVPKGKGKRAKVAGAVPSKNVPANIPRFKTARGDTYIIQKNPDTNMLETIILYDLLTRPYYYPGFFQYPSYASHSPFMFAGPDQGRIVLNEAVTAKDPVVYP